jgi:hypothetical protein
MPSKTIADRWSNEHNARSATLDRARWCAAHSKPWFLPPIGQTDNESMEQSYTSIAQMGVTNLSGKMGAILYPAGEPFFSLDLAPKLRYAYPTDQYQRIRDMLFVEELKAMALLESAHIRHAGAGFARSFRSQKRVSIDQCIITGDTLEQLTSDFRIRVFRRDQYVTKRDGSGAVLRFITCEKVGPQSLTPQQIEKAEVKFDDNAEDVDLFTLIEFQPITRKWVVTQEINGKEIGQAEHRHSRYYATAYELPPGENYGRGLIELNQADLAAFDILTGRTLDFAAAASMINPVLDSQSQMDPKNFEKKRSGEVVVDGRVIGGVVQDVGYLKVDKMPDFQIVNVVMERLAKSLGQAMLLEGDSAPRGEAGRHSFGWKVMLEQLQGLTGGVFSAIGDENQIPLVAALLDEMRVQRLIHADLQSVTQISTTTGLEAIGRRQKLATTLETMDIVAKVAQFNPEIMQRIDHNILLDMIVRMQSLDAPGLIKSRETMARERQAAEQAMARQQATQQMIQSAGTIAEQGAQQALQPA